MLHVSLLHLNHEPKILTSISQTSAQNSTQEDFIWARHEVRVDSEIDKIFNGIFHFHPPTSEDWQRSGFQVSTIFLSLSFITSMFRGVFCPYREHLHRQDFTSPFCAWFFSVRSNFSTLKNGVGSNNKEASL